MLVCHCKGVSSRQIDVEISMGADSVEEIGRRCGAGTKCGDCVPLIEMLLESRLGATAKARMPTTASATTTVEVGAGSSIEHETQVQLIAS